MLTFLDTDYVFCIFCEKEIQPGNCIVIIIISVYGNCGGSDF